MPSWNEAEFVQRAQRVAVEHVTTRQPLNDLAEKVARDENLSPDEIRTLVRLSNVATFQQLFKEKTGGDKMIEFEVGEPDAVIQRMLDSAAPPQSANAFNDKLASEIPDEMRVVRYGPEPESVKEASAPSEARISPTIERMRMRKLATEFDIEAKRAAFIWEDRINEATRLVRQGANLDEMRKSAHADLGSVPVPELSEITLRARKTAADFSSDKIAALSEHHLVKVTPELRLVKEAVAARDNYMKYRNGLRWIAANFPE